jgi:hypothetical protein
MTAMSQTYRLSIPVAMTLMFGCAQSETPRAMAPKPKRPAPVVTSTQVSPAVAALLKPDPDLDRKMTPEEIKAALAAAQRSAPAPATTAPLPGRGTGEWQKLEADQKAKSDEYERRLASTTVYIGPDGRYHNAGCPMLTEMVFDRMGRVIQERFVGRQTTLASARDQHLSPHAECGAPSYQWSYAQ